MLSMEMDMVQYDCPYIAVTQDYDVSFFTKQWDFNTAEELLETRIVITGADRDALDNGLSALTDHERLHGHELLKRNGDTALLRSRIGQTNAMGVIRENNGYITGPFEIRDGSERWRVGFDTRDVADDAIAALDRENEFSIESETSVGLDDYYDLLQHVDAATTLLDGCRELSAVERATLETAVDAGYFTTPRDASLSALADEFDVSKTAVSKNLRRGERKILERVAAALTGLDG